MEFTERESKSRATTIEELTVLIEVAAGGDATPRAAFSPPGRNVRRRRTVATRYRAYPSLTARNSPGGVERFRRAHRARRRKSDDARTVESRDPGGPVLPACAPGKRRFRDGCGSRRRRQAGEEARSSSEAQRDADPRRSLLGTFDTVERGEHVSIGGVPREPVVT